MRNFFYISVFLFSSAICGQSSFTSSNLPIVVINTNGLKISDEPKITANMKIISNEQGGRNYVDGTNFNYNGFIGIELRGNSSQSFDQKQYTLETRDAEGNNLNVSLLGMPEENDWVLHAPYNDISLIRNVLAYNLWNKMGHWGPRTMLVEFVLNSNYQGVYVLTEAIKRDKKRVDIAELKPTDTTGIDITGGYIMKIDASNSDDDLKFQSKVQGVGTMVNRNVTWLYHYPGPEEIHPKQKEYIRNYIETVEQLIQSDMYDDPEAGYAKYLSVSSFIDYFIHTELSLNPDGYKRSAYFYKEKQSADGSKGKLKVGPVWDFNLAFGNCNFCKGNKVEAWVFEGCETSPVPALWPRLMEDTNFVNAVKCRYSELRKTVLSDTSLYSFIDKYAVLLDEAKDRHFAKWDDLLDDGSSSGGFWGSDLWYSAYRVSSYKEETDTLKGWLLARLRFLDKHFTGECSSSNLVDYKTEIPELNIYPNPTSGSVFVESADAFQLVEVYNMNGKKLVSKTFNNCASAKFSDFNHFSKGLYLIIAYSGNGNRMKKLVVKQ